MRINARYNHLMSSIRILWYRIMNTFNPSNYLYSDTYLEYKYGCTWDSMGLGCHRSPAAHRVTKASHLPWRAVILVIGRRTGVGVTLYYVRTPEDALTFPLFIPIWFLKPGKYYPKGKIQVVLPDVKPTSLPSTLLCGLSGSCVMVFRQIKSMDVKYEDEFRRQMDHRSIICQRRLDCQWCLSRLMQDVSTLL